MTDWFNSAITWLGKPSHLRLAHKEENVEPQRLFEMLDGRDLFVSNHHWHVEVYSVSDQSEHRWVQVGLTGDHDYMLTIRLENGSGAQPALQALSSWLQDPSEGRTSRILNVA